MAKNLEIILMSSPRPFEVNGYKQEAALAGADNLFPKDLTAGSKLSQWMEGQKGKTVVVVDDNEIELHNMMATLSLKGATVFGYQNPDDALREIINKPPDAVLSDYNIPEMSGSQLARSLRDIFSPKVPRFVL